MNYCSSTSSWKPWRWVRLNLILLMRDIYINFNLSPFTKFTSSCRSTKFKGILPWNISRMITKTVPISTRSHKQCNEMGHPGANSERKSRHLCPTISTPMSRTSCINPWKNDQNFSMEGNPSRKVNHLSNVIWDRKIIKEFTRSISSTRIGKPVLIMDVKVFKDKPICRWAD